MPRRTMWLVTGVVAGAASSLYAERKLRRAVEAASARLQPDALVGGVGRTASRAARGTGGRVRDAYSTGRSTMRHREEELWAELAASGALAVPDGAGAVGPSTATTTDAGTDGEADSGGLGEAASGPMSAHATRGRGRGRRPSRRSPSHLGK